MTTKRFPKWRVSLRTALAVAALAPVIVWGIWGRARKYPAPSGITLSGAAEPAVEAGTMISMVFDHSGVRPTVRYLIVRVLGDRTGMSAWYNRSDPMTDQGISIARSSIYVYGERYLPTIRSGFLVWNPVDRTFVEIADDLPAEKLNSERDIVSRLVWERSVVPVMRKIRETAVAEGVIKF